MLEKERLVHHAAIAQNIVLVEEYSAHHAA